MKILFQGSPFDQFPRLVLKIGASYLCWISGVNLSVTNGVLEATPLYTPMLSVSKRPGQLILDVPWRRRRRIIVLQLRPPFLWSEAYSEVYTEEDTPL